MLLLFGGGSTPVGVRSMFAFWMGGAGTTAAPTGGPFPFYIRRTMRGGMIDMGM